RLRAGRRRRGGGVRRVTASAPGKLFVTGEYAVLAGAPALLAAVDRRARVHVALEPGAGPLEAESLAGETRRVIHDPEREPLGGGDAGAVLAALRIARAAAPSLAAMRAQVVVDTRAFLADGEKLGLGRSAATVTAAVAAFLAGRRAGGRGGRARRRRRAARRGPKLSRPARAARGRGGHPDRDAGARAPGGRGAAGGRGGEALGRRRGGLRDRARDLGGAGRRGRRRLARGGHRAAPGRDRGRGRVLRGARRGRARGIAW